MTHKVIYTVTFNPSLDYFITVNGKLMEGKIMKSTNAILRAGGKGVNISLVLAEQNLSSKAVMFLGGYIGDIIDQEVSSHKSIDVIKVAIEEESRINVKITSEKESAINANGPYVSKERQNDLLKALDALQKDDFVIVSGSYCQGVDAELVERIGEKVREAEAYFITDVPNLTLENYRKIRPYLIKPNHEELGIIFNTEVTESNYRHYAHKLVEEGVGNVLISLGKEGSYFVNKDCSYKVSGPSVKVVDTVGCGDSMLGYTLGALYQKKDITDALRYGEAAGRVKAGKSGLPTMEEVEAFLPKLTITKEQ